MPSPAAFLVEAESRDAALKEGIAAFYDASSGVWEEVWGEHMHHGYYGPDGSARKDHRQAQVARRQPLVVGLHTTWGCG